MALLLLRRYLDWTGTTLVLRWYGMETTLAPYWYCVVYGAGAVLSLCLHFTGTTATKWHYYGTDLVL